MRTNDHELRIGVCSSVAECNHGTQERESIVMKRFHVHVHVGDLNSSVRFYSALFGAEPSVLKTDYAKWMLDDPRVNFAITSGASSPRSTISVSS